MRIEEAPANLKQALADYEALRAKLNEAEATLQAIRSGDVDAVVVYGDEGERVYTLKGAEQPYRIFVEQMNEGALTLSEDGVVLYSNMSGARLCGVPLERLIGCNLKDVCVGESNQLQKLLTEADREGTSRSEVSLRGDKGPTSVIASITRLGDDHEACYAVTLIDLSELKRNERTIQEKSDQLTAANKELEGFCYSVSHDLRAPLRSVVMAAMILREDFAESLPADAQEELDRMTRGANKMSQLIDDLLKFSRLGRQEMKWQENVDLSALAESVARDHKTGDAEHVQFHVQPGLTTTGDSSMLRMVLDNLIGNAVKFTKENSDGQVWFGKEGSVYFVRDNGVGFEMQHAEKLFRPFERLHPENRYPGSGIGLANVQRIVARHGGTVWAEGVPDEGATFYFTLAATPSA